MATTKRSPDPNPPRRLMPVTVLHSFAVERRSTLRSFRKTPPRSVRVQNHPANFLRANASSARPDRRIFRYTVQLNIGSADYQSFERHVCVEMRRSRNLDVPTILLRLHGRRSPALFASQLATADGCPIHPSGRPCRLCSPPTTAISLLNRSQTMAAATTSLEPHAARPLIPHITLHSFAVERRSLPRSFCNTPPSISRSAKTSG